MNEIDKLRVLIPHWIEHSRDRASELRSRGRQAGNASKDVLNAADAMARVNESLVTALKKMGGPLPNNHFQGEVGDNNI